MNFFLQINRKFILFIIIILVILSIFIIQNYNSKISVSIPEIEETITDDIINPKFTLNNKKQIIKVTADKGQFISNDLIMLKKNVEFHSENFKIYSNEVMINNLKQTAESNQNARFFSDKTEIQSEGFKILEAGDKIEFNGKTKIILN